MLTMVRMRRRYGDGSGIHSECREREVPEHWVLHAERVWALNAWFFFGFKTADEKIAAPLMQRLEARKSGHPGRQPRLRQASGPVFGGQYGGYRRPWSRVQQSGLGEVRAGRHHQDRLVLLQNLRTDERGGD